MLGVLLFKITDRSKERKLIGWGVIWMTVITRTLWGFFFLICLCWFPATGALAFCQEKPSDKAGDSKGKSQSKAKLPALYSKLGLSSDQARKLLEIQAKYQEEIQQLQRKMTALKGDMKREILETLGPEQRARLEELQKAARAKDKD
ncbi:MAG: hypothetical protein LW700_10520 [Gemmataceae bacterium]|nr:hypothetical protein [Gemmataceae bacterium]